jgi:PPM family protein phosphatase
MKIRPGIEVANLTDVGCQRERNEDSFDYWEPEADTDFGHKGRLAVVADGMGGYEGGQEASQMAIRTVRQVYEQSSATDPQSVLVKGLEAAHQNILDYASRHPGMYGMGTTCTAASIVNAQLFFAHVGDSRLYLIRDKTISRLTRDHSYVARLVESGVLRPEDAEHHPQRHVLTAALGVGAELIADTPVNALVLRADDVLVLCTDGLWGVVTDQELLKAASLMTPDNACRELVKLAKSRGGPDNITVQVMRVSGNGSGHASVRE